jgi:aspartate racemase
MKTIGIIGGMSWESTATYYQLINREVARRLGGFHSAPIVLHSVDFAVIEDMVVRGDWEAAGRHLASAAAGLEGAGADVLVLATNTVHKVADDIEAAVHIPFLHIVDATGTSIIANRLHTVGLLGTRYTMELDFYRGRLTERFGLDVIVPSAGDRARVDDVIFSELVHGKVLESSKQEYLDIIDRLTEQGAEGVILGCTELGMLIRPEDLDLPVFDTTELHVMAVVDTAIEGL